MSSANYEESGSRLNLDHLRYVVVMWFLSRVRQLLPIRFTQQNLRCIKQNCNETFAKIGPPLI